MAGGGTMAPMALMVSLFDGTPLWVLIYFLRAIGEWKRLFL